MDLILLRHPPPDVAPGICYGSTDLPVDAARFAACVDAMSARVSSVIGARAPSGMHSSPLRRARDAATRLAAGHGLDVNEDARLAEIHFGEWEMTPWDTIAREQIDRWAADVEHSAAPGGESAAQVALRLRTWLDTLCERGGAADSASSQAHVVVAHAGPIRLLTAQALSLPLTTCLSWSLDFGGLCHLRWTGGLASLVRWNG